MALFLIFCSEIYHKSARGKYPIMHLDEENPTVSYNIKLTHYINIYALLLGN